MPFQLNTSYFNEYVGQFVIHQLIHLSADDYENSCALCYNLEILYKEVVLSDSDIGWRHAMYVYYQTMDFIFHDTFHFIATTMA